VIRWHDKPGWLTAFGIGITIGLILSIRPSDVIVLAVPALWNIWNLETLKAKFNLVLKHWLQVIVMMAAACVIVLPQLLYWRLYAGEYFVSVYNDPSSRMDWKHPDLINVLFSFRKGWLIYSPLIILSLAGIATGLRKNRRWFLPTVVFIILNLYLISCFTSLISYGWRAFLQSYALLLLPLAVFVQLLLSWNRWIKVPFFIIIIFFTYVNIVQAKQIIMGVTDGSRMTKSAFFKVFGRWNAQKPVQEMRVKRTGHELDTLFTANGYNFLELMNFSFEDTRLQQKLPVDSNYAFNGKYSLKTDSTNIYSPALKIRLDSLGFEDHFWVHAHVRLFSFDSLAVEDGNLVVTVNFNRQLVKYKAINCRILKTRFIPGNWNTVAFDYLSPEFIPQDAKLEIYFWNRGKKPIWIDELRAFLYTPKTMD
jgi:hypothetical protein